MDIVVGDWRGATIGRCRLLGRGKGTLGVLKLGIEGVRWRGGLRKVALGWGEVVDLLVEGESVQRTSVAAIGTFGVLGLGAKRRSRDTIITITTLTGELAFRAEHVDPSLIRTKLHPILAVWP